VIDISVHQKGIAASGTSGIQGETKSGCLREDINDKGNIGTDISHLSSYGCSSFGFRLFNNRRLSWCHGIIVLLNIGLHERKSCLKVVEMMPFEHSPTFDTGLRLPARDAGFAAALEAGLPPASRAVALEAGFAVVSVAAPLEAGFTAALDAGLAAALEAGLTAA